MIIGTLVAMLRRLMLISVMFPCLAQTTQGTIGGSVSGTVLGEDKSPIVGAYVTLHLRLPITPARQTQRNQFGLPSSSGGAFRFDGLKDGTYNICVQATGTIWLDPCEWGYAVSTVTVASGQRITSVTITF